MTNLPTYQLTNLPIYECTKGARDRQILSFAGPLHVQTTLWSDLDYVLIRVPSLAQFCGIVGRYVGRRKRGRIVAETGPCVVTTPFRSTSSSL